MILPLRLIGRIQQGNDSASEPVAEASQCWGASADKPAPSDAVSPLPIAEILPRESDLYYLSMRAISQSLLDGLWVDYRRPGVLEASAPLLNGQRICVDHRYYRAEDAIGAITQAQWDAEGANSNGVPGVNVRFFIDSKVAPGVVRRLAYPVPAIHSGSVTVGFEWEPSHPQLLEDGKFFWFLGEEVEGQVVRLIATRILFYREYSLVYEGADADAKRLPDAPDADDETDDETEEMKRKRMYAAAQKLPQGETDKERTVKLTTELKKILGLESHAAEDVPDGAVLTAVQSYAPQIAAAQAVIAAERVEVLRLATLAEGVDGKLSEVMATMIAQAAPEQLPALKTLYAEKAEGKFPQTCQKCGASQVAGRSSVEPPITDELAAKPVERIPFF